MSKHQILVKKLKEIFQIDQADLDFGIYKILKSRSDEITQYLEKDLKVKVEKSLKTAVNSEIEDRLQEAREKIIKEFGKRAFDDGGNIVIPEAKDDALGKEYLKLKDKSVGNETASSFEDDVFAHLTTFFSRYYEKGDFISKRRYKGDTYAIPHNGEEVVLHWANKDQYYTKSGEYFSNYTFTLEDERKVHFKLIAADTEKDNIKETDKERCFVLVEDGIRSLVDDDGDEYEEQLFTLQEIEGELYIFFKYKTMPKGTKQDNLNEESLKILYGKELLKTKWSAVLDNIPTESNPKRTLLEKQLKTYTAKNTADYFIHKDLRGFLKRELDFYIKNEVMHLDDIQNIETFHSIEHRLRMIQVLREVAHDIISFLSQIENFQKKLWLKKKFVVETNYCITLDRVPEELYSEIAANDAQREEWVKLFAIDEIKGDKGIPGVGKPGYSNPLTIEFLKANDKLVLDTKFFDEDFKAKLLASIHDFDEQCDGILIHSENFQALNLLQERYREQVKCVYIDPPYNTSENAFLYKNFYKHSSWLSMMSNGLSITPNIMTKDSIIMGAIDDTEYSNLKTLLSEIFGNENNVGTIAVEVNPAGQNIRPNVPARSHDYFHIFSKNIESINLISRELTADEKEQYKEKDNISHFYWDNLRRRGGNSRPKDRPKQWFPLFIKNKEVRVPKMEWDESLSKWIIEELPHSDEKEVWPIDPKGDKRIWRVNPDGARDRIAKGDVSVIEKAGRQEVSLKTREPEGKKPKTLWAESKYSATSHGTKLLLNILGPGTHFSYPKSIYLTVDAIKFWADSTSIVLDFFAGSGTTGNATINLNRENSENRKYILVEMGEYFDTALKPRILKVIYTKTEDWKNGKPTSRDTGISHCFKYLRLESYEDTLNNLELKTNESQKVFLKGLSDKAREDYLLNYMLNFESASLLSTDVFKKPFDYKLNISFDSSGASKPTKIDLVETFNYLIGLKVSKYIPRLDKGYLLIEGENLLGEKILVFWRDCEKVGYDDLDKITKRLNINPKDFEYDILYINGDHNIPNQATSSSSEGEITYAMKLRQIEEEFLRRMFDVNEVV